MTTTASAAIASYNAGTLSTAAQIADSAANIVTNLDGLQTVMTAGKISSISLTDSGTATVAISSTQLLTDGLVVFSIQGNYTLSVDGLSLFGVERASAAVSAFKGGTRSMAVLVSDTAANVVQNLDGLEAIADSGEIVLIVLTDGGTPTLSIPADKQKADSKILNGAILSPVTVTTPTTGGTTPPTTGSTTPPTTTTTPTITTTPTTGSTTPPLTVIGTMEKWLTVVNDPTAPTLSVSDSAKNIGDNIDKLQPIANAGKLGPITLNDPGGTPTLTLSGPQYSNDKVVLDVITPPYSFTIIGASGAQAPALAADPHLGSASFSGNAGDIGQNAAHLKTLEKAGKVPFIAISDGAANVAKNLDQLQTLVGNGATLTITLTDGGTPTLAVTAQQATNDAGAIGSIQGGYSLALTGASASQASSLATNTHVTSVAFSDSAANVAQALGAIQSLVNAGDKVSIALTDSGTPTLTITGAQAIADAGAINDISTPFHVAVSGTPTLTTAAVLAANRAGTLTAQTIIGDSAANITSQLDTLQTLVASGKIGAIVLSDSNTPTLSLTGSQYTADANALSVILGSHAFALTNVSASTAAGIASNVALSSLAVADSAANVVKNLDGLQSLAAGPAPMTISLTDGGTPTLTLTTAQLAKDATALSDITGSYSLGSGVSTAISKFIVTQDAARIIFGSNVNTDVPGISSQSGTNSVIGFQSAGLPAGAKNVVVLDGPQANYTTSVSATGTLTVTDHNGGATNGQTITVTGASAVVFNANNSATTGVFNQFMVIATGGDAAIAKMYQSVLGRLPDLPGLEAWEHQFDAGLMSLAQISQAFLVSNEFTSRFGAVTGMGDSQFITQMYTKGLGRAGETSGFNTWLNSLATNETTGATLAARGQVALGFATSSEMTANTSSWLIDPGNSATSAHNAPLIGVQAAPPWPQLV